MNELFRTIPDSDAAEDTIAAAILGELIPELEYATPTLLARLDRGEPLIATTSPTDPGFETGAVDSVLLELFRSLVPYVKLVLSWGALRVIQGWFSSQRQSRHEAELLAMLTVLIGENSRVREAVEKIAERIAIRDGLPTSVDDVARLIGDAVSRLSAKVGDRDGE